MPLLMARGALKNKKPTWPKAKKKKKASSNKSEFADTLFYLFASSVILPSLKSL